MTRTVHPSPVRLRPPRNHVDPRAVTWWRLGAVIETVVVAVALGTAYTLWEALRSWLGPTLTIGVTVVFIGGFACYIVLMPRIRFRVHAWEVTDDVVYARSGWLVRQWRVAPVSRVQTVDTVRGPVQRWLGLSTVTVTTASARGPIRIDGLSESTAHDLSTDLARLAGLDEGDAT